MLHKGVSGIRLLTLGATMPIVQACLLKQKLKLLQPAISSSQSNTDQ